MLMLCHALAHGLPTEQFANCCRPGKQHAGTGWPPLWDLHQAVAGAARTRCSTNPGMPAVLTLAFSLYARGDAAGSHVGLHSSNLHLSSVEDAGCQCCCGACGIKHLHSRGESVSLCQSGMHLSSLAHERIASARGSVHPRHRPSGCISTWQYDAVHDLPHAAHRCDATRA